MALSESCNPTTARAYDQEAARAALHAASTRFARLLRETDDIERQAAGTDWTVAETAAHVAIVLLAFSAAVTGEARRRPRTSTPTPTFRPGWQQPTHKPSA